MNVPETLGKLVAEKLGQISPLAIDIAGGVDDVPWSESLAEQVAGLIARALREREPINELLTVVDPQDGFISIGFEDGDDTVAISIAFRPRVALDSIPILVTFDRTPADG